VYLCRREQRLGKLRAKHSCGKRRGNGKRGEIEWLYLGENIGWINFNSLDLFGYGVLACKVNYIDLNNLVADWLKSGPDLPGDLDDSNDVDFLDYASFSDYWLTYCPDDWPLK